MEPIAFSVVRIVPESRDSATIFLTRKDGLPLQYKAGQFLTFLFKQRDQEMRRSYSLSTAPGIDEIPAITVRRVTNGAMSRHLLDHLRPGDTLHSLAPSGMFTLEAAGEAPHLVFIGAGSGMGPVYGLLKKALRELPAARILLISQHHSQEDTLFSTDLLSLASTYTDRFHWINLLSSGRESDQPTNAAGMEQHIGRLNNWLLEELLGKWFLPDARTFFYLCGPAAFMRMAQFTLKLMGYTDQQIRKESFTVEYVPPPPLITDTSPKQISIHIGDKIYRFETAWPKNILQAALEQHIPLPYSCRGGRCSTCVARCMSGQVKMSINDVLTEKDLREGLVLTCVGFAETDLELRIG